MTARSAQGTAGEAPQQEVHEVCYFGQPIALVVADTFEQARDAAKRIHVDYAPDDLDSVAVDPDDRGLEWSEQKGKSTRQGDLDHAMSEAPHGVDATYTTQGHASAAMEPHATIAQWTRDADGETLTVHSSLQMLNYNVPELADALGLEEKQVRILSRYVGGGFGSKLGISPECVAASIAAMELERPVRVVMSRQQVFQCIMRRSETTQRVRLAADADGHLTGFGHESRATNLPGEDFFEPVTQSSAFLYAGENRLIRQETARIHRMTAGSVRAPGEAVGMPVLECAMDELANTIGLDPVELRLRNIPEQHPSEDKPYSSRKLAECLQQGAEAFGWDGADRTPACRREGEWWIGTGMATASRVHNLSKAAARVTLNPDGTAEVATDMTDIGTGTYTVLGQIAGEMLGLDPADVLVRLGDSRFPTGSGSGGSWGAPSTGSAVFIACQAVRAALCDTLGCEDQDLTLKDGFAIHGNERTALPDVLGGKAIARTGAIDPGKTQKQFAIASYGAFFAEVAVNAWTGETRMRRMLGVFGIGRVLNAKTAGSQCLGGMVWGIGSALTEELLFDPRRRPPGQLRPRRIPRPRPRRHSRHGGPVRRGTRPPPPVLCKPRASANLASAALAQQWPTRSTMRAACVSAAFQITPDKVMAELPMP